MRSDPDSALARQEHPLLTVSHRLRAALGPWEVARWGRLLAGMGVLLFTTLSFLHHPYWLAANLLLALHLILASITGNCLLRNMLMRLGAREREDLFLPGGAPRREEQSS